jgi:hypothetical protein
MAPPPYPPPLKNYAVLSYLGEIVDVAKQFHRNTISALQPKCIADHGHITMYENPPKNICPSTESVITVKNSFSFNGVCNDRNFSASTVNVPYLWQVHHNYRNGSASTVILHRKRP